MINGIVYAVDSGADVILMALSSRAYSTALQQAIDYAWDRGVVLVAAVGNDGSNMANLSRRRSRGHRCLGNRCDRQRVGREQLRTGGVLAAPGAAILTTGLGGGYQAINGTSASAAFVAGAAALIAAQDASLTNA